MALALGWGTDLLFYGKSLGVSVPLFVLLLLVALFWLSRAEGVRLARRNLWLLVPLLFFASTVFLRVNAVLTVANLAAVAGVLGLLAYFCAADRIERLGLLGYPAVVALAAAHALTQPAPVVSAMGHAAAQRRRLRAAIPLGRGLLLALPVLALFTALLSSADTIFAGYVGELLRFTFLDGVPELLWRLTLILAATWLVAGGLLYALGRGRDRQDEDAAAALPGSVSMHRRLGFVEAATVLVLVDLLFAVFAWFQFAYLFSGEAARTMHYEAYREYVRRGFGELLVVSVLAMALILGLRWLAQVGRERTATEARIFNGLSTLMIGLVAVMLVSAFQRMLVWESVEYYINTQLRIYVRWFIIWLGLAFGWLGLTLWLRPDRFAVGAFVAALGFLATINIVNPDADVAAYNLARRDELSTRYLSLLSDDAVPVLAAGLDEADGDVQRRLREHLSWRLARMEASAPHWQSWPSFHLARWWAYERLVELRRDGKIG